MKPTLFLLALTSSLFAAERPEVTVQRQTSGDTAVQPKWEKTLTITVGSDEQHPNKSLESHQERWQAAEHDRGTASFA